VLDVVETIRCFNAGREPERLAMKYANMSKSPFVFLRGACHLFYDRLPAIPLPAGAPSAWVCGDLHLENFGSYKGDNRLVYFDVNDFDESALAPVTWDLVRLLASVLTAAESLKIQPAQATSLCRDFIAGYAQALETGKARWVERDTAQGLIKTLLEGLKGRKRVELLDRRTELNKRRRVIRCDREHALKASAKEQTRARELVHAFAATQDNPRFFEVLDVARRVAGTGSLGVERYVVLVRGKGSPDGNYLLDLKEAQRSSLVKHLTQSQPTGPSEAERIVAAQTRLQAVSAAFLHPIDGPLGSYVLRGLQPSEDSVRLNASRAKFKRIREVLQDMGRMVAWAQLRSSGRQGADTADALIAFGADRKAWQGALLNAARQCAKQTAKDWKTYAKAYDQGAFKV